MATPPEGIDVRDLAPIAELAAADGARFRAETPAALRKAFRARAAAFFFADPENPARTLGLAATVSGRLKAAPEGGFWLAEKILADARESGLRPGLADPRIERAKKRLAGYEPERVHAWPIRSRDQNIPDGPGPEDATGAILVFDPDARSGSLETLGAAAVTVLSALLDRHARVETAETSRRNSRIRLGGSRELVGRHPTIAKLRETAASLREPPLPLLVTGEPGTGKRHLARFLADSGALAGRRFVRFETAGRSDDQVAALLFEDWELHGPLVAQPVFLFIPEALGLPLAIQELLAASLPPLFEGAGGAFAYLTSTRDPEDAVRSGRASRELVALLAERTIQLPPLRQRLDDLPSLAETFLLAASGAHDRQVRGFTHRALELLRKPFWRENLLELQEVVSRAVCFAEHALVDRGDLEPFLPDLLVPEGPRMARTTGKGATIDVDEATLLAWLGSPHRRDWEAGIAALEKRWVPAATPMLFERLSGSPEPIDRMEAFRALARQPDASVHELLCRHLSAEQDRDVLSAGLEALADNPRAHEASRTILAYLHDGSPEVRVAAARALARLGPEGAAVALSSLESDPHPRVLAQALAARSRLGDRAASRRLAELFQDARDAFREAAAEAAGEAASTLGVEALLSLVAKDSSIGVRIAAATALGRRKEARAATALIDCLDDPQVRFSAIEALREIGVPEAKEPLLSILQSATNSLVRRAAIAALAATRDPLVAESLVPFLEERMLGKRVVDALATLGGASAERSLIGLLEPGHRLCKAAIDALGRMPSTPAVLPLVDLLGGVPDFISRAAADALSKIGPPAVDSLIEALADPSRRAWAIVALGEIRDPRAVADLLEHWDYSEQVRIALEKIGPAEIPILASILPEREDEIRELFLGFGEASIPTALVLLERVETGHFAEEVLVSIGPAVAGPLAQWVAMKTRDEAVLARVLRILAATGAKEGFPLLLKHLAAGSPALKSAVLEGFQTVANPLLVEAILDRLEESDPAILVRALAALSRIGTHQAAQGVSRALGHPDPVVRAAAVVAAWNFGSEARQGVLSIAASDSDPLVGRTAASLAAATGELDLAGMRARLVEPGVGPAQQVALVRWLALVGNERSTRILASLLAEPLLEQVLSEIAAALAGRDASILPLFWPLVESSDRDRAALGTWILERLAFSRQALGVLLREHTRGSPIRRRAIETHLARHRERAADALARALAAPPRPEDRFTILYLLRALEEGHEPCP